MSTDWKEVFQKEGAIWLHDGRAERPHALLTSGLHSDGFVNCTFVTQRPALLQRIVTSPDGLAPMLPGEGEADWVVGSAFGAITLAFAVGLAIRARAGFTEKEGDLMRLARFDIPRGAQVLVVEDVISTGGSTMKTMETLRKAEVNLLRSVVCLVNRSGLQSLDGRTIHALMRLRIHSWQPPDCPLCQQGSRALRPKAHWQELTGG